MCNHFITKLKRNCKNSGDEYYMGFCKRHRPNNEELQRLRDEKEADEQRQEEEQRRMEERQESERLDHIHNILSENVDEIYIVNIIIDMTTDIETYETCCIICEESDGIFCDDCEEYTCGGCTLDPNDYAMCMTVPTICDNCDVYIFD